MKYIRVESKLTPNGCKIYPNNVEASFLEFIDAKVAEADTIEELCDEFVLKTTSKESGKSYYGLYYYSDIKQFKVKEGFKGIWYGAIWTDKGLIYVAKMNDEGELVLI